MKLLNEMMGDWDLIELRDEIDVVLERYNKLIYFTQLNEGVLDNLSDDLIQRVAQLQNRIDAAHKAREIIDKLVAQGEKGATGNKGMSKEEASKHRKSIRDKKKSISAALKRTMAKMEEFEKAAKKEIKGLDNPEPRSDDKVPTSDVNLEVYGRQAPFLMRLAYNDGLDVDKLDYEKYEDTIEMLKQDKLITDSGSITDKGKDAFLAFRAKKKEVKPPSPATRDSDIEDMLGYEEEY